MDQTLPILSLRKVVEKKITVKNNNMKKIEINFREIWQIKETLIQPMDESFLSRDKQRAKSLQYDPKLVCSTRSKEEASSKIKRSTRYGHEESSM